MVNKKADSNLNNDQRRNLAHIAKILQFAASKKGFANESPHLEALNPFIIECHERFKLFFAECCQVGTQSHVLLMLPLLLFMR
jgi:Ras GTPase-activating-like protein IQGAP2/3/Ras GTPase-activating-like protein IQGAP1